MNTLDHHDTTQASTAPSIFVTAPPTEAKGRAINFTAEEPGENGLHHNKTIKIDDLSDVSMDDDDDIRRSTEGNHFSPG